MSRPVNRQFYRIIVAAWFALSVGSVALVVVSSVELYRDIQAGWRIAAVHDDLNGIDKSLLDTETGERGYLITGNTQFLEPFDFGRTNLPAEFDDLLVLVHDDPSLLRAVTELRARAAECLSWQHEAIDSRGRSFSKTVSMDSAEKLKSMMDRIRAQIADLDRICLDRRATLREEVQTRVMRAFLTGLGAGIVGIGAGFVSYWLSRVALKHQENERKLLEAKLRAEHNDQEKTAFLTHMSHEIRTPLNAILGFSELLHGELGESRNGRYLQSIRSSAASLLQLINDILDVSRIEAGAVELRPEPTDLRELCSFINTLFSELAAKKGIQLACHMGGDFPHSILIDRGRLRQILVNLVGNAVKFTDRGSVEIRITWKKEATGNGITLVIEVQDTGVGIPQDKLDAIFQAFVQAGANPAKEKQGTGLGLAIVKRLTEAMGGTVAAASVLGQGSAFHLRFPGVPLSARLPKSAQSPSGEVNFDTLRPATLLVVDDNDLNRELIAGMFADTQHRLFFGSSGPEAIARAGEVRPDVMLLDIRMPGMDGCQALKEIRKLPGLEMVPGIAMSASAPPNEINGSEISFDGFVRKPFSKRELFEALAEFLPRREASGISPGPEGAAPTANFEPTAPELLAELHRLMAGQWAALRDTMAISECKDFAQTLAAAGKRWDCDALIGYARRLYQDADSYDAAELEKDLGEFSSLVEQLDNTAKV